jgi:hypothetical protein
MFDFLLKILNRTYDSKFYTRDNKAQVIERSHLQRVRRGGGQESAHWPIAHSPRSIIDKSCKVSQ